MKIINIIRLIQTVRHLKLSQIYYQIFYRIFNREVKYEMADNISYLPIYFSPHYFFSLSTDDGVTFDFLGSKGSITQDWNPGDRNKLWLYKLHYLDDLNAIESDANPKLTTDLVNNWILFNDDFRGNGWEPYPLSLRIVNLIKWFSRQDSLDRRWLKSLAEQTFVLCKKIEYHICANHLFANAKALVFSGSFLTHDEAKKWQAKGLEILDRELDEQFLKDGAHFELSPMYHSIMLWDMCDLVNLAMHSNSNELKIRIEKWRSIICNGLVWLNDMLHPDNKISFFNDSAFGIAPDKNSLENYAKNVGCNLRNDQSTLSGLYGIYHPESGYASINSGKSNKLIIDLARVGPDYQPGHAHADSLSFELSIFSQRIFVNSGTSQYGNDKERHRQRSTAAHNTVEINNQNSSDVWAGFRVGKRARTHVNKAFFSKEKIYIEAYHDGYRNLFKRNIHCREWLVEDSKIVIVDTINNSNTKIARFYVHPDVIFYWETRDLVANLKSGKIVLKFEGANNIDIFSSSWHPEFGVAIENQCISVEFSSGKLKTNIQWSNFS